MLRLRKLSIRLTAFVTLFSFILANHFGLPAYGASTQFTNVGAIHELPLRLSSIAIPTEIGKIQELYQSGTKGPAVILVQDAHAIPEAQRNIQKIIGHFQKEYGVRLVGFEGAASQADPQIFRSFPDQEALQRVAEEYFERGELTGANAAALLNPTEAVYHGVEDWNLYQEALRIYLQAMNVGAIHELPLQKWKERLDKRKEKIYSPKLLEIDRVVTDFQKNHSDLSSLLKMLAAIKPPEKGTELAIFLEEDKKDGGYQAALERKAKEIAEKIRASFFRELEAYMQSVKESLFRNDEERKLDQESRQLYLLTKLAKLELSREEWNEIKANNHTAFSVHFAFYRNAEKREQAMFVNLTKLMNRSAIFVAGGFHTKGLTNKLKEHGISYVLVMPQIGSIPEKTFYREHMRGKVSWKNYFEVEGGQINFYKAFVRATRDRLLNVGAQFIAPSEGVINHAPTDGLDPHLLKSWRDQIIIDLANKREIERAQEYTQYLDELTPNASFETQNNFFAKRFSRVVQFIAGLRNLQSRGQLTDQNIMHLFQPATVVDPSAAILVEDPFAESLFQRSEVRSEQAETPENLIEKARDSFAKRTEGEAGRQIGAFRESLLGRFGLVFEYLEKQEVANARAVIKGLSNEMRWLNEEEVGNLLRAYQLLAHFDVRSPEAGAARSELRSGKVWSAVFLSAVIGAGEALHQTAQAPAKQAPAEKKFELLGEHKRLFYYIISPAREKLWELLSQSRGFQIAPDGRHILEPVSGDSIYEKIYLPQLAQKVEELKRLKNGNSKNKKKVQKLIGQVEELADSAFYLTPLFMSLGHLTLQEKNYFDTLHSVTEAYRLAARVLPDLSQSWRYGIWTEVLSALEALKNSSARQGQSLESAVREWENIYVQFTQKKWKKEESLNNRASREILVKLHSENLEFIFGRRFSDLERRLKENRIPARQALREFQEMDDQLESIYAAFLLFLNFQTREVDDIFRKFLQKHQSLPQKMRRELEIDLRQALAQDFKERRQHLSSLTALAQWYRSEETIEKVLPGFRQYLNRGPKSWKPFYGPVREVSYGFIFNAPQPPAFYSFYENVARSFIKEKMPDLIPMLNRQAPDLINLPREVKEDMIEILFTDPVRQQTIHLGGDLAGQVQATQVLSYDFVLVNYFEIRLRRLLRKTAMEKLDAVDYLVLDHEFRSLQNQYRALNQWSLDTYRLLFEHRKLGLPGPYSGLLLTAGSEKRKKISGLLLKAGENLSRHFDKQFGGKKPAANPKNSPPSRSEVRGESATLNVGQDYKIVIKHGDLRKEKADGMIVPMNTAFAIGGASADVFDVVNQARLKSLDPKVNAPNQQELIYRLLFPSLRINNPIHLSPGQVVIDLESRPEVAATGTAVISKSLRAAGIPLDLWDRVIAAFIRNQGDYGTAKDLQNATWNAVSVAEKSKLESIVLVPFGTGFIGRPAAESASLMIRVIQRYFQTQKPKHLKKITFVMNAEGQFRQFLRTAKNLLRSEVRNEEKVLDISPIGALQGKEISSLEDLKRWVEKPFVAAAEIFYQKKIKTVYTSANQKDLERDRLQDGLHYTVIGFGVTALTESNLRILRNLSTLIHPWKYGTIKTEEPLGNYILIPVTTETTVQELSDVAVEIANKFESQEAFSLRSEVREKNSNRFLVLGIAGQSRSVNGGNVFSGDPSNRKPQWSDQYRLLPSKGIQPHHTSLSSSFLFGSNEQKINGTGDGAAVRGNRKGEFPQLLPGLRTGQNITSKGHSLPNLLNPLSFQGVNEKNAKERRRNAADQQSNMNRRPRQDEKGDNQPAESRGKNAETNFDEIFPSFAGQKPVRDFHIKSNKLLNKIIYPKRPVNKNFLRSEVRNEQVARAIIEVVKQIHGRGISTIVLSGGSTLLTYRLLTAAWTKVSPTPLKIYRLSQMANGVLLAFRYEQARREAEELGRPLLELEIGGSLNELKKIPICYLDTHWTTGIKRKALREAFHFLGLNVQFAVFTASSKFPASHEFLTEDIIGSRSPMIYQRLSFLARRVSQSIHKYRDLYQTPLNDANIRRFESALDSPTKTKLEQLLETIQRSEVRTNDIFPQEVELRSEKADTPFQLVRSSGVEFRPDFFAYDVIDEGTRVISAMERAGGGRHDQRDHVGNVEVVVKEGKLIAKLIDLGDRTGHGLAFPILNFLAKVARENNFKMGLLNTSNAGLLRTFERVSDFKFDKDYLSLILRSEINLGRLKHSIRYRTTQDLKAGVYLIEEQARPHFGIDLYYGDYRLNHAEKGPVRKVLFGNSFRPNTPADNDKPLIVMGTEEKKNEESDWGREDFGIRPGVSLEDFSLDHKGNLFMDGKPLGRLAGFDFQIPWVEANPRPIVRSEVRENQIVEFEGDDVAADVLAQLSHPSLPKVWKRGTSYVREWIPGIDIEEWVYTTEISDEDFIKNIISWTLQIGDALKQIHRAGIEHGDIHWANIILRKKMNSHELTPVIIDWRDTWGTPDKDLNKFIERILRGRIEKEFIQERLKESRELREEFLRKGISLQAALDNLSASLIFTPQARFSGISFKETMNEIARQRFDPQLWNILDKYGNSNQFLTQLKKYYTKKWGKPPRSEVRRDQRSNLMKYDSAVRVVMGSRKLNQSAALRISGFIRSEIRSYGLNRVARIVEVRAIQQIRAERAKANREGIVIDQALVNAVENLTKRWASDFQKDSGKQKVRLPVAVNLKREGERQTAEDFVDALLATGQPLDVLLSGNTKAFDTRKQKLQQADIHYTTVKTADNISSSRVAPFAMIAALNQSSERDFKNPIRVNVGMNQQEKIEGWNPILGKGETALEVFFGLRLIQEVQNPHDLLNKKIRDQLLQKMFENFPQRGELLKFEVKYDDEGHPLISFTVQPSIFISFVQSLMQAAAVRSEIRRAA